MHFRYFVLTALLVGVALLAAAPVQGSGASSVRSQTHRSPHLLSLANGFSSGVATSHSVAAARQSRPAQQVTSGVIQSSAQMKLSPSVFPVDFGEQASSAMTAADADQSPISIIHTTSYENLGMLGGWLQDYSKPLDVGSAEILYLGSYYRDSDAAKAASNDVASNLVFGGPTGVCSFGDQCIEVTITATLPDGTYQGLFRVVQKSNAVGEFLVAAPQASSSGARDQVRGYADSVTNGFLGIFALAQPVKTLPPTAAPTSTSTPTPTPTPTSTPTPTPTATSIPVDFSIVSARVEKNKAKPDVNLLRPALKRVKVGTKVYLSIYLVIRSAPAGGTITFQYDVTAGGRSVLHRVVSRALGSFPSGPFREFTTLKLTQTGKQVFTAKVTLNERSEAKSTSITVVR